jgi:CBS domain containing-hemolysin-like protein
LLPQVAHCDSDAKDPAERQGRAERADTKPLDDLLGDLRRERASMAVVVDEYGRTAGIVTIEPPIEEIVGEISAETDPAGGGVRRLANGDDWWVRGHVPITDLADYGLDLPADFEGGQLRGRLRPW